MLAVKTQVAETSDGSKPELYRLIGEGYKAMHDGRTSSIDEVREKLEKRREEYGPGNIYETGRVRPVGYRILYFQQPLQSQCGSKNIGWNTGYDIKSDTVYIIRILYNKADWQDILKR